MCNIHPPPCETPDVTNTTPPDQLAHMNQLIHNRFVEYEGHAPFEYDEVNL